MPNVVKKITCLGRRPVETDRGRLPTGRGRKTVAALS